MARVLHVEDDPNWRRIISSIMESVGHKLVSCSMLSDAQKKLAEASSPFDLIICDGTIGEDRENGLHWAEQLHAEGKNVVVLSGFVKTAIPYVRKSDFTPREILKLLKR